MAEETVSKNFIEQEIDKDLAEGVYTEVCTRFRQSRMDTFISDMQSPFFKFRTCERIRWNISFKI